VKSLSLIISLPLVILLALAACGAGAARTQAVQPAVDAGFAYGSLAEIRDKRNMLLVVGRSFAVDARAPTEVSDDDVRRALEDARAPTNQRAYRVVGTKLNAYIRKYRSMTSVETREEADFLVVFKVMQERRSFISGQPYSYGKLFVVVRGERTGDKPRVLWESKGEMMLAEDAAGDLIKALKEVRGEK
jgi:hypothetical protein